MYLFSKYYCKYYLFPGKPSPPADPVDAITIKLHIMINGSFMPAILCYIQFGNINVSHDHIFLRQFLCKNFYCLLYTEVVFCTVLMSYPSQFN